jgi:hypothetical protein
MTDDVEQKAARPHDELICELLDSRIPKNEREHAAAREIERLRAEVSTAHSAVHYHIAEHAKTIARAERLAEAVRGWWEMHRPVGWTEDQHRACPHVNLATDAEKALATALRRDQEEGHEQ